MDDGVVKKICSLFSTSGLESILTDENKVSDFDLFSLPIFLVFIKDFVTLEKILQNPNYIKHFVEKDDEDFSTLWAFVEETTTLRVRNVYREIIDNPGQFEISVLEKIGSLLQNIGYFEESLNLFKASEEMGRMQGSSYSVQNSLGNQARMLCLINKLENSMDLAKEQEKLCRESGFLEGLQKSIGIQGDVQYLRKKFDAAMILYKDQERICKEYEFNSGLQKSLGSQANIYSAQYQFDQAMDLYRKQEKLCRKIGNKSGLEVSLVNQGLTLYNNHDVNNAKILYEKAEQICKIIGAKRQLLYPYEYQGCFFGNKNDFDNALLFFKMQEQICRDIGLKWYLKDSLLRQVEVFIDKENADDALALIIEAELICLEISDNYGIQMCFEKRGQIFYKKSDLESSMKNFKEQEKICRENEFLQELQRSLVSQAAILVTENNFNEALVLYKEQEKICSEINFKQGLADSLSYQAWIFQKIGKYDESLKLYKREELVCRNNQLSSLARSLVNQAYIFIRERNEKEALILLEEAKEIALCDNNDGIIKDIDRLLERCKSYSEINSDEIDLPILDFSIKPLGFVPTEFDKNESVNFHDDLEEIFPKVKIYEENMRICSFNLPFYEEYKLYSISDISVSSQNFRYILYKNGDINVLDRTNEPIYHVNEKAPIKINENNCISYAQFFFHFVRGTRGRFIIVEKLEDIDWLSDTTEEEKAKVNNYLKPIMYRGIDSDNLFTLTAIVVFKNALFKTDIKIASAEMDVMDPETKEVDHLTIGQIRLMNEELLLENLNVFNDTPMEEN